MWEQFEGGIGDPSDLPYRKEIYSSRSGRRHQRLTWPFLVGLPRLAGQLYHPAFLFMIDFPGC